MAEIILEGSQATPNDLAFGLAIAWRDYLLAQRHLQKTQLQQPEINGSHQLNLSRDDKWQKLLGSEKEVQEALAIQQNSLKAKIQTYQQLTPLEQKQIPPEWQCECGKIIRTWDREQSLAALRQTPDQAKDKERSR